MTSDQRPARQSAVRRYAARGVAIVILLFAYGLARIPTPGDAERAALAGRFHFTPIQIPDFPGTPPRTVRQLHPALSHVSAWFSSMGASVALNDLDGDGLPNDACLVDPRSDRVIVMPVPGTGGYEWRGFRQDLPKRWNPVSGYIATANNNINVTGYWPPVTFKSINAIPTERVQRVEQVINDIIQNRRTKFTIDDSKLLQHDAYQLQASYEVDLFKGWTSADPEVEKARKIVASWGAVLDKNSAAAAIYSTWRQNNADPKAYDFYRPLDERRPFVEAGLVKALAKLKETQGPDMNTWRWGKMHTQGFDHPFVGAFNLPTIERSGGTGSPFAGGASYREIMDTGNWDASQVTNVPGQSGQPESEYYNNLLPLWDRGEYFPMLFSRGRVDAAKKHTLTLKPSGAAPSSAQQ